MFPDLAKRSKTLCKSESLKNLKWKKNMLQKQITSIGVHVELYAMSLHAPVFKFELKHNDNQKKIPETVTRNKIVNNNDKLITESKLEPYNISSKQLCLQYSDLQVLHFCLKSFRLCVQGGSLSSLRLQLRFKAYQVYLTCQLSVSW